MTSEKPQYSLAVGADGNHHTVYVGGYLYGHIIQKADGTHYCRLGDVYRNVGRFSLADGSYPSHDAVVTAIDDAYQELIRAEEDAEAFT